MSLVPEVEAVFVSDAELFDSDDDRSRLEDASFELLFGRRAVSLALSLASLPPSAPEDFFA